MRQVILHEVYNHTGSPPECPHPDANFVIIHDGQGNGDVCSVACINDMPHPKTCSYAFFRMLDYHTTMLTLRGSVLYGLFTKEHRIVSDFIYVHTERSWMVSLEEANVDMEEGGDNTAAGTFD
jgi:hypothetical protein